MHLLLSPTHHLQENTNQMNQCLSEKIQYRWRRCSHLAPCSMIWYLHCWDHSNFKIQISETPMICCRLMTTVTWNTSYSSLRDLWSSTSLNAVSNLYLSVVGRQLNRQSIKCTSQSNRPHDQHWTLDLCLILLSCVEVVHQALISTWLQYIREAC